MLPGSTTLNTVAREVADALRECYGIDPKPLLDAAGIDLAVMHAPRGRHDFARMQTLWQAAGAATGDPCFGLRVGQQVRPTSFSVLGVTWMASDTLRDAIRRLCRYSRIITTAPHTLRLEEGTEPCWLHFDYAPQSLPAAALSVDALFASVTMLARLVTRPGLRLAGVRLRRNDEGRARTYEEFFGCVVRFREPGDAMAFETADLDAPLVGRDSDLAEANEVAADKFLRTLDVRPVTGEVQRMLVKLLPSGEAALEVLARRMNRGLSTLQRQLQEEGMSFRQILDETRCSIAEGYLDDHNLSLNEITYLLGFADQSSFSRAFRRWTGVSPRHYRERRPAVPTTGPTPT